MNDEIARKNMTQFLETQTEQRITQQIKSLIDLAENAITLLQDIDAFKVIHLKGKL
jgi:hypothetical protein